ncbi:hypothetical protein WJX72_011791 [[Myrmecia] bisecta]|uniref:Uncharacterized protein n=1 Tax=[Myrmecia] bisecta TaxID=41462 RepID=A0AAW1Q4Q5_9CHLO
MMSVAGRGRAKHKRGTPTVTLAPGPESPETPSFGNMAAQTPPSKRGKVGDAVGELVRETVAEEVAGLRKLVRDLHEEVVELRHGVEELAGLRVVVAEILERLEAWESDTNDDKPEVSPKQQQPVVQPAPDTDSEDEEDIYGKVSPPATS